MNLKGAIEKVKQRTIPRLGSVYLEVLGKEVGNWWAQETIVEALELMQQGAGKRYEMLVAEVADLNTDEACGKLTEFLRGVGAGYKVVDLIEYDYDNFDVLFEKE